MGEVGWEWGGREGTYSDVVTVRSDVGDTSAKSIVNPTSVASEMSDVDVFLKISSITSESAVVLIRRRVVREECVYG